MQTSVRCQIIYSATTIPLKTVHFAITNILIKSEIFLDKEIPFDSQDGEKQT